MEQEGAEENTRKIGESYEVNGRLVWRKKRVQSDPIYEMSREKSLATPPLQPILIY